MKDLVKEIQESDNPLRFDFDEITLRNYTDFNPTNEENLKEIHDNIYSVEGVEDTFIIHFNCTSYPHGIIGIVSDEDIIDIKRQVSFTIKPGLSLVRSDLANFFGKESTSVERIVFEHIDWEVVRELKSESFAEKIKNKLLRRDIEDKKKSSEWYDVVEINSKDEAMDFMQNDWLNEGKNSTYLKEGKAFYSVGKRRASATYDNGSIIFENCNLMEVRKILNKSNLIGGRVQLI